MLLIVFSQAGVVLGRAGKSTHGAKMRTEAEDEGNGLGKEQKVREAVGVENGIVSISLAHRSA